MAAPRIDLTRKLKDILGHVQALPPEAEFPLAHYDRTSSDLWTTLRYAARKFNQANQYPPTARGHLERLTGMVLINLCETFERFLKEAAAACIDCLAPYVLDDRLNVFRLQGGGLAAHFDTDSLGKSLCESTTWLDCEDVNERFRKLLADPFQQGGSFFFLFPKQSQHPAEERWRFEVMGLVWQLRHSAVHNVGVITQSDAFKLRLWAKENVASPRLLTPTLDDVRYLKRFLDETAVLCNTRIGQRLAELLSTLYTATPTLFRRRRMADRITRIFGMELEVAGIKGALPAS
jgi:hypothetical protein